LNFATITTGARAELPWLLAQFDPAVERASLFDAFDAIALGWHTISVGGLLVDAAPNLFRRHLLRVGEDGVRLQHLCEARQLAAPPASKTLPLLAALAAGDFSLAAELARLTRTTRAVEDHEYEDEFLWGRVLAELAAPPVAAAAIEPRIFELRAAKGSAPYIERIAVVRAICARDQEAFSTAFVEAARTYEMAIEQKAGALGTSPRKIAADRFIWLEGLALLGLATRFGLKKPDRRIRFCPPLALVSVEGRDVAGPPLPLGAWE